MEVVSRIRESRLLLALLLISPTAGLPTERYRASVESFKDLFDSISDAIYIQDKSGKFLEVNKGAEKMYGYDREEFIGRTPDFLAAPGKVDMESTIAQVKKALEGEPQTFKFWGKRKNGEVFPKEVTVNPGTYFGEDVVIAIGRDVSERYEVQEQIRKNEEMFRQLFQNAHIGIVMMDERQEVQLVNNAFERIFGYTSEEIKGLDIDKVIVPESEMEEALQLSKNIFFGESSEITAKREAKDGSLIDVLVYGVPVIVGGNTVAIFGMYVDITERKNAEERVRRSLKEKEVLLAEIHHRVKNNLAVITGLLELQRYNTPEKDAQDALYESQMRVNSIALIHEKLYQSEDLSQISFDIYIKELADIILKSMMQKNKNINLNIDADPVELTVNQAIPCGLILNEVITNSFKHAFRRFLRWEDLC
ncbi:MAG: PAS domain S-box protein [Balneolaceae bacterium]|nr:PAS domain S-box protein [Balneolaceae bacterium]